jgi:hypothetical protein
MVLYDVLQTLQHAPVGNVKSHESAYEECE